MIKTDMDFWTFMDSQKKLHRIPEYKGSISYEEMAERYSLNNRCNNQPDFFLSIYYTAMYVAKTYFAGAKPSKMNVYRTTGINEEKMFEAAYQMFCTGREYAKAFTLMRPLAEMDHLEAINLMDDILRGIYGIRYSKESSLKGVADKCSALRKLDILDVIGLCFEMSPFALERLSSALDPGTPNDSGVPKNATLWKIINEWLTVLYSQRISENKNDGYAMYKLSELYCYGGAFASEGYDHYVENAALYERYWLREAARARFAPAENQMAYDIAFDPTRNIYEDFIDYDKALEYAKDAKAAGYYDASKAVDGILTMKQKQQNIQREVRAMRQSNSAVEAKMQEYRDKLDRQEMFVNGIAHGMFFTNEEEKTYGWLTKDYDRVVDNYILGQYREEKERKYREKLMREQEAEQADSGRRSGPQIDNRTAKPSIRKIDLAGGSRDMKRRHADIFYLQVIQNQNMLPTQADRERFLDNPAFQTETKEKAKRFFEGAVAAHAYNDHTVSTIKFRKSLFASCDDMIEILEDGSVEVFAGSKSQFDSSEKKSIRSLKNIVQVACFKFGLLAIDGNHNLIYIGKEEGVKTAVQQIRTATEILSSISGDSVYCLMTDGAAVEITKKGVSSPFARDIKKILSVKGEICALSNSGDLRMEIGNMSEILSATTETFFRGDNLAVCTIGICRDGSLWCMNMENLPKELLELNGVVSVRIYDHVEELSVKVKLYTGEKMEFKVRK